MPSALRHLPILKQTPRSTHWQLPGLYSPGSLSIPSPRPNQHQPSLSHAHSSPRNPSPSTHQRPGTEDFLNPPGEWGQVGFAHLMDKELGWGVGVDLPASWTRNRDVGSRERWKLHKGPGCAWGDQDHGMLTLTFLPHLPSSNKVMFYLTSQEGTL